MDFELMHNIQVIAEQKSINKAAKQLYISQPALTNQLKSIEEELGTSLFIRSKESEWRITPSGEIFLKYTKEILNKQKEMRSRIADITKQYNQEIRIGSTSIGERMIPAVYSQFNRFYPEVRLVYVMDHGKGLEGRILNETIDCATVVTGRRKSGIEYYPLVQIELVAVLPKSHPDYRRLSATYLSKRVPITEFASIPVVLNSIRSLDYISVQKLFKVNHIKPVIHQEGVSNFFYRMQILKENQCFGLIGEHHLSELSDDLAWFPLVDAPKLEVCVLYKEGKYLNDAEKKLFSLMKEYWNNRKISCCELK